MPRTPTGTLTKKIQFQLMLSTIRPPTSGPIASASAETPAQMPIAWPRCRGGNVAVMIESVAGFISAAPMPCTARAPIRKPAFGASPQASDESEKIARPIDEDLAPAEHVGELAAGDQQRREDERVAGDDPLELRDRDLQILRDRGQRDVHDGVVEHDHEEAERDSGERPPLLVLLGEDSGFHPVSLRAC